MPFLLPRPLASELKMDRWHVSDLVRANSDALRHLRCGAPSSLTLNCGYGHGFSVFEVIEAVECSRECTFRRASAGLRARGMLKVSTAADPGFASTRLAFDRKRSVEKFGFVSSNCPARSFTDCLASSKRRITPR